MTHYEGRCHCGDIRFSFESEPITKGLRCTCSLCARRAALMSPAPLPEAELKIDAKPGSLGLYQFGARTAKHYFCKTCGIYTFHETARFPGYYRVNLACVEGVETFGLDVEIFDGKNLL